MRNRCATVPHFFLGPRRDPNSFTVATAQKIPNQSMKDREEPAHGLLELEAGSLEPAPARQPPFDTALRLCLWNETMVEGSLPWQARGASCLRRFGGWPTLASFAKVGSFFSTQENLNSDIKPLILDQIRPLLSLLPDGSPSSALSV